MATRPTWNKTADPAHWLREAGELEANTGLWFNRAYLRDLPPETPYYQRYDKPSLEDAKAALPAAYPDRLFEVSQHGSQFSVLRLR